MTSMEEGQECLTQLCRNVDEQFHQNVVDISKTHKVSTEHCTACRSGSNESPGPAIGRCITCQALLCRSCVFAHKFMLCFQGHDVVPLQSANLIPPVKEDILIVSSNCCKSVLSKMEEEKDGQLNDIMANLNFNDNVPSNVCYHNLSLQQEINNDQECCTSALINAQKLSKDDFNLHSMFHQEQSLNSNTVKSRNAEISHLLEKVISILQVQHWKAAVKINDSFATFKEELNDRKQTILKVLKFLFDIVTFFKNLDEGYFREHKRLISLFKELNANAFCLDIPMRMELTKCCENIISDGNVLFEFLPDFQMFKRSLIEICGYLRMQTVFEDSEYDKNANWVSDNIINSLSSGYGSSLSTTNHSSYIYPTDPQSSDLQCLKRHSSYVSECNQDRTRTGLSSQWSLSENACYWLQDPFWSNDSVPIFSSSNEGKRVQRMSDVIETSPSLILNKASIEFEEQNLPVSPGGLQGRYTDLSTCSIQSPDPSLSVGSCCCASRPISSIRRQKMVYHCKFGEFGGLEGQFTEPSGVAVNYQSDIIVADTNNHRIQVFDRDGRFKFRFGECGKRDGQLLYPNRVAVFKLSGDIVVTERSPTHQVQIFNQNGTFVRKFGSTVLQHPRGVCVDPSGNIIVAECKVMRVFIFDRFGNAISRFNCSKHLEFPNSVCANDKQEIFISDNRAHCVKVFSYDGRLIRTIGGEGVTNFPIGVGMDNTGNVLVADNHNNFNLTLFSQSGQLLAALESKVKHAQCFDAAVMDSCGSVVLSSKDYHIYIYRYLPIGCFNSTDIVM